MGGAIAKGIQLVHEAALLSASPFADENALFSGSAFVVSHSDGGEGNLVPVVDNLGDGVGVLFGHVANLNHVEGDDDTEDQYEELHDAGEVYTLGNGTGHLRFVVIFIYL